MKALGTGNEREMGRLLGVLPGCSPKVNSMSGMPPYTEVTKALRLGGGSWLVM